MGDFPHFSDDFLQAFVIVYGLRQPRPQEAGLASKTLGQKSNPWKVMNHFRQSNRQRRHAEPQEASPDSKPHRRRSLSARPVIGSSPLILNASTASADQAAKGARIGCQDAAQVSATGCRQCGHVLPEWSRKHLKRCQNVRCIRSTGLPKAGRWSGNCTDWLCKYGSLTS